MIEMKKKLKQMFTQPTLKDAAIIVIAGFVLMQVFGFVFNALYEPPTDRKVPTTLTNHLNVHEALREPVSPPTVSDSKGISGGGWEIAEDPTQDEAE